MEGAFDEVNAEYRLSEMYTNAYVLLGVACLGKIGRWADKKGISRKNVRCVFETGDQGQGELISLGKSEGFDVLRQSKATLRAFDACDLLAWKSRSVIDDTYERQLHRDNPAAAERILKALDQLEKLTRSSQDLGQLSANGLRNVCFKKQIPKRS